jgi:hypothetical protein
MLYFDGMAYRRKSKEAAIFESIAGLSAVAGFFYIIISPGFRSGIQMLTIVVVLGLLIALAIRLFVKAIKEEQPSARFRTFSGYPFTNEAPITESRPPVSVEELKDVQPKPEPAISGELRKPGADFNNSSKSSQPGRCGRCGRGWR